MKKLALIINIFTGILVGCTSTNQVNNLQSRLQGNWSGSYVEEFEIKSSDNLNDEKDLEKALAKKIIKITVDSIKFEFQGEQLIIYKGRERFLSLNQLLIGSDNKEITFTNISEPKYLKSFVIEKITIDSLIIKEKNNIIYFKEGNSTSNPDTTILAQYYNLKKNN